MTDALEPRGVYRPTTCATCKTQFYADTAWDDGQVVLLARQCPECSGQPALFGGNQ